MQEKDRSTDIGPEGREQNVLPGAEREANARFLQRKAEAPLKPKAEQKPADQGLFGDGHKQKELFSTGTARTTARDNALAIIQQVAGEDVVVNFAEKIVVPKGHVGMAKWGALASDEAAGSANKIDRLINISLNPEFETNNTAYHEAYHLIEDLKTKQERALFRRELPRLRALAAADMGMSRVEAEKVAPSEIEAQAFAAYAQGREKGIHIGIRAFFAKLLKIIRRIRNMMQGLGYRTSEDFYDAALRSEVQARGLEGESTGEQFSPGKRSEPIFFSAVVRSVESAKLTKATPDQWMGYLRNQPGVKAEELSWLGVEDWLAGQKSVSKEALADFVRANQVEVREVEKSAPGRGASDMVIRMLAEDLAGQNGDTWDSLGPNGRQRYWDQAARRLDNGGTKFASYQLPGGENYRELLLTLPVKRAVGEIPPFEEWLQSQPWINSEQGRLMAEGNKRLLYEQWVKREEQGKNSPDTFRSSHWDEPNVLAHVRFNEREVNGKRVLFIEEIQSDWHQRGRKAGYNTPAASEARQKAVSEAAKIVEERRSEEAAILDNAVNFVSIHVPEAVQVWTKNGRSKADRENVLQALRIVQSGQVKDDLNGSTRRIVDRGLMHQALAFAEEIEAAQGASRRADFALTQAKSAAGEVPDAPFKTTWPELSLKRMVRYAAENGFDSLAWTPGAVQAERYDLSKQVSELHYFRGADRRYTIDAKLQGQSGNTRLAEGVEEKQLPDYVGKELADKIANNEAKESVYSGLDLKVGGEGMIGFYDRMLPSIANKLGKKFGAKVGETRIPVGNADMTDAEKVRLINEHGVSTPAFERARPKKQEAVHSLPITDSMRESVMSGQALFSRGKRVRRDPTAFFDTPEDRRFLHRFLLRSSFGMLRNGMFNQSLFRRRFQDRARIIQDMQDAIEAAGGPISDDTNLYQTESLYYGKAGEGEFHLRTRYVEPLVRKMNGFGIDRTDLDEFIYALHAHERNAKIRQINPAIADPSGMSDAEARAILQRRMTGNQAQHYLELADDVQKIVRWTRDRLFNAGLISQQVYDEWSNAYANYVPLRGWEADPAEEERVRAGQGFDLRAAEAYAALGRHSRADSPLAYVILQAKQAVLRAEKNKVALTLGRVAKDFKNRQVWEVNRAETKRRISPVTGLVEDYYVAPPAVARMDPEHVIVAKSRGKAVYITIHDERLLKAMRMKGADELGAFLRQLSRGTRLLARLYTAYDPDYLLRNLSRDTQTALFHLSEQQIKGLRLAVLRDWAAATTGMYRYLRGDQSNSHTWLRYARDFAEAGGKVSFFNMESLDEEKRRLDSALNRRSWIGELQRGRPDRAGLEIARAIEGIISDSNGAIENAIRLSVFVNLRRHGVSPSQAASVARELTVNFNRKGEWSPAINSAYIFFNAGAQGVVRVMQFAKRHPKAFVKIAISLAALGAGSDWWNYLIAGEDPKDGMNFWDKVPEYDKQRNFIIMEHGTGKYLVRIPMTYIYNVFEVFGGAVSAVTRNRAGAGRGMEPLDAAIHVLTSAINAYSPLEMGSSLLEAVSPTVIDPLVQIARNKDWKNSPVAPEKQDERDRNADLYFRGVNPVWKQFADWMERGTKIDERKPAIVDLSPEWMEHIFNTFFGGAGQFWVDRIGGNILKAIEGEPIETKDIPFVRTFRGEVNDYVNQNIYYGLRDDVLRIYDLSLVAPDRAAKYPVELAAAGDFLASEKILSKLRRARKEIDKDPNISSKDRATAVDEIQAEMTTTMDNARAAWEAARKRINGVAPAP